MNSNSISDYVDAQARQASVQANLQKSIDNINSLKKQLADQKAQVQTILNAQVSQRQTLVASQTEQQSLENANAAQQAEFNSKVSANNSQISKLREQQKQEFQNITTHGVGALGSFVYKDLTSQSSCGSGFSAGYSWCGAHDSTTDKWNLYNRECVSYAAWRIEIGYRKTVNKFHGDGNAYEWAPNGNDKLGSAGLYDNAYVVTTPQPGDVAIAPATSVPPVGHAMVVESVLPGGWVHVSQMNFDKNLSELYSEMDVKDSGVIFLRFP